MKDIVDVCCGGKMFWYNKHHPRVLYLDNRDCDKGHNPYRKNHEVKPDIIMDFRKLNLPSNSFKMVVFDPPHFKSKTNTLNVTKLYGVLNPETWKEDLLKGFNECMRVLEPNGFLVFKWNESSISIKEILNLFPIEPLFGNKQGTKLNTHWIVFMKNEKVLGGKTMNSRHFDVKDMEREYKRGRVEELKELHNKMCFKHFDMNPERYSAVKEYVGKRLLKLQGVEK